MANSFHGVLGYKILATLVLASSGLVMSLEARANETKPTKPSVKNQNPPETEAPETTESEWLENLKLIQEHAKTNNRREIAQLGGDFQLRLNQIQKQEIADNSVEQIMAEKQLLSSVIGGENSNIAAKVQSALLSAAASAEVKTAIAKKEPTTINVVQNLGDGDVFDVKVSYEIEGADAESVVKRKVELVPKDVSQLEKSSNQDIKDLASNPAIKPVLKKAVDEVVKTVSDEFASEGLLQEKSQNVADLDGQEAFPERTDLAAKSGEINSKLGQKEASLDVDLSTAEKIRDIASEERDVEEQRLQAQKKLADWASQNSAEAKKLDECGLTRKALELSPEFSFDMLDESAQKKCASIAEAEGAPDLEGAERKALSADSLRQPASDNASTAATIANDKAREQAIKDFMQVVQSCMVENIAAVESIKKIEQMIQPAYEAISGFDELEKMLQSSTIATNVLGKMSSEGLDGESAAIDVWVSAQNLYPNTNDGNTQLHSEMGKLFRINGKLAYYIEEYKKRTEQMARAVGESEVSKFAMITQRAQAGDPAAQAELNSRAQQGLPMTPQDIYKVAYDAQYKVRQSDPKHLQMLRYSQAVEASFTRVASLYNGRKSQIENASNNWVVGGSTSAPATSAARQILNGSNTLRSAPGVAVDNAFAGGLPQVSATMGQGLLRSTGAQAPGGVIQNNRQPANIAPSGVRSTRGGALH